MNSMQELREPAGPGQCFKEAGHCNDDKRQKNSKRATLRNEVSMRTIDVKYLSLSSYTRLCSVISVCLGIVTGTIFFIADILGVDTSFHIGVFSIADFEGGALFLLVGPFVFALIGFLGSLLSHRLFLWALRTFRGLTLTGEWETVAPMGGINSGERPHVQDKV
jgi:hypothetical protein